MGSIVRNRIKSPSKRFGIAAVQFEQGVKTFIAPRRLVHRHAPFGADKGGVKASGNRCEKTARRIHETVLPFFPLPRQCLQAKSIGKNNSAKSAGKSRGLDFILHSYEGR